MAKYARQLKVIPPEPLAGWSVTVDR